MTLRRQPENADLGYSDTPILPDSGYHVHDGTRPQPPIVTPGEGTAPPSDAVVLFDGRDLSQWETLAGEAAAWKVEHGYMEVVRGTGDISSRPDHDAAAVDGTTGEKGICGYAAFGLYAIAASGVSTGVTPALRSPSSEAEACCCVAIETDFRGEAEIMAELCIFFNSVFPFSKVSIITCGVFSSNSTKRLKSSAFIFLSPPDNIEPTSDPFLEG